MSSTSDYERRHGEGFERTHPALYASLLEDCAQFWDERLERYKEGDGDEVWQTFVDREAQFVDMVHSAVSGLAASREGPLTLLLDIDETFLANEYEPTRKKRAIAMHVRPGMDTLIRLLDASLGDRYDIGLLTFRPQSELDSERATHAYGYMQRLGNRLNQEFVISSHPDSLVYTQGTLPSVPRKLKWGEGELAVKAVRSILRPELVEPATAGDTTALTQLVMGGRWYDGKLAVLAHLAAAHPERGFVFVDDKPYAASIDPNHPQVRGVALQDAAFLLE